jgi:hypothetical protein
MENALTFLGRGLLVLLATALIGAFLIMSPMIFCHGAGGSGGHCGEGLLISLPGTMIALPLILILAALFFFPSRKKILLTALTVGVVGILSGFGVVAKIMNAPPHVEKHPEKVEEWQAANRYTLCLEFTAQTVSRTSTAPPEAIEQTSLARCEKQRQDIFDTFRRHDDTVSPEAMVDLEQRFRRKLPQIIGKARG